MNLQEKLNAAEEALNGIETTEDYIKHGLNTNRSEKQGIRLIIGLLRKGEETHTVCVNIRNFFESFGIATEEDTGNRRFIIKPRHKDIQIYENEPWYADLHRLLENGYCRTKYEYKNSIFSVCGKLSITISYRRYFGCDYIIRCGERDRYSLKRYNCLAYFLEKAKKELNEYSENIRWDSPKAGFLKEWADAAFRYERLRQMMDEIYHHHNDFENIVKIYVGTIGSYCSRITKTENPHRYISNISFCVEYTSNAYSGLEDQIILQIDHQLGIDWFIGSYYNTEWHSRYEEGKNTTLRAYVDSLNVIRRLEWVE
ncbi:MAG: hypothetical protein FWG87_01540 [Defluviitaleaceae bacterium]|nr:hypothetical protein [Defluviitaleaceae bacterium]